MIYTYTL